MDAESTLYLYLLKLEGDKFFVYVTRETDEELIKSQCAILHDFVYKYHPLAIIDKQKLEDIMEVDTVVKKRMQQYGIENVRGGTYSKEILPDFLIKSLELEFSFSLDTIKKQDEMFAKIVHNYLPEILIVDKQDELTLIHNELDDYKKIVNQWKSITNNGKINRNTVKDIEWLIEKCETAETEFIQTGKLQKQLMFMEDDIRYKNLLGMFKEIYAIFREQFDKPIDYEYMIFIERPHCLLDTLFYNAEHICADNQCFSIIQSLLKKYEYMTYSIINRSEEYEFDLTTYPTDFLKQKEYQMYVLTKNMA